MAVVGVLPFLLYVSVVINIVLVWFSLKSIKRIEETGDDIDNLLGEFESFAEHLEQIHSLDMFYGDENLQNLIDHSKTMVNRIIDFQDEHYEVEVIDEEDDDGTEEDAEATPTTP
tara:strand:+ start:32264 stop:32608 length:345 start_codon:yes stop_codon:yes gene_type:complete